MTTDPRIPAALAAADEGMETATNAADPRLVLMIDAKIAELNASGKPWSANDARDALPVVCSGLVGARVKAASMRVPREMVAVRRTRSTLLSTHGAFIVVWRGVES
jgi:hypothetical protein